MKPKTLLTISFTSLVFFVLFSGFFHPITAFTQDLGRHIIMGEIILQTSAVPKTNLFSYTYPDFPFINTHWLSEVIFSLVDKTTGSPGLLLLTIITVFIAFALPYFYSLRKTSLFSLGIVSFLYLRILFERTDIRPEVFSFLLLSAFVIILYHYRETRTRWSFLLPLLSFLWVNIHIYFFVGIFVLGLFLLEQFFFFFKIRRTKKLPTTTLDSLGNSKTLGMLTVIFFTSCLATLFNPNGLEGALYPLRVFDNYGYAIEENQNIFFLQQLGMQKPSLPFFEFTILLVGITLLFVRKKTKLIDWLLFCSFSFLGILAVRNLPLFVFATMVPFSLALAMLEKKLVQQGKKKFLVNTFSVQLTAAFFVIGLLLWNFFFIIHYRGFGYGVEKGAQPAVDFLLANNIQGPLFNNFDIGSYLDYRLYPKERVFIDGRPEAYPASFFHDVYIPMQENPAVFENVSNDYGIQTIFFSHSDQTPWARTFLQSIAKNPAWAIIYLDDYVIVLIKNTKENESSIKNFRITETSFSPTLKEKTISELMRYANVFSLLGWTDQEKASYVQALQKDNSFCPALYGMTHLLVAEQHPSASLFIQRFQGSCS